VIVIVAIGDEINAATVGCPVGPPFCSDILWINLAQKQFGVAGLGIDEKQTTVFDVEIAFVDEYVLLSGDQEMPKTRSRGSPPSSAHCTLPPFAEMIPADVIRRVRRGTVA
jgi:hypothetical protein